jgi:hypothetical protein
MQAIRVMCSSVKPYKKDQVYPIVCLNAPTPLMGEMGIDEMKEITAFISFR